MMMKWMNSDLIRHRHVYLFVCACVCCIKQFNRLSTTGLCLFPLKISENHRFYYVFRRFRKRPVALNGLIGKSLILSNCIEYFYTLCKGQGLIIL